MIHICSGFLRKGRTLPLAKLQKVSTKLNLIFMATFGIFCSLCDGIFFFNQSEKFKLKQPEKLSVFDRVAHQGWKKISDF